MNFDLATAAGSRAVIVVEGMSDRVALETLAERRGLALGAPGISIVHLGGATNIGHFLDLFGPRGLGVRLAGLCDAAEEGSLPARPGAGGRRLPPVPRRHGGARFLRVRR